MRSGELLSILVSMLMSLLFTIFFSANMEVEFSELALLYFTICLPVTFVVWGITKLVSIPIKKAFRVCIENFRITIDEHSIKAECNVSSDPRVNFFNRGNIEFIAKQLSNRQMEFEDIKSVDYKYGNLRLRTSDSFLYNLTETMMIPEEMDEFDEIKAILATRLQSAKLNFYSSI